VHRIAGKLRIRPLVKKCARNGRFLDDALVQDRCWNRRGPLDDPRVCPIALGGVTGDALESIADGAFGRVAERPRERRNRGVLLPQSPLGEKHPRLRQIGKRSNPGDRLEMEGEGRPGHCGRLGEFLKPPRTAGIAVHQPERASEPPIADRRQIAGENEGTLRRKEKHVSLFQHTGASSPGIVTFAKYRQISSLFGLGTTTLTH
jgi:hypothetical protein